MASPEHRLVALGAAMIRSDLWCPVCRGQLKVRKVKIERARGVDHHRRYMWCEKCRMGIRIMRIHGDDWRRKARCRAQQDGHGSCHLLLGHSGPHEDMHGLNWKVVSV